MSDPPELSEDVDFPLEHRRYVLESYARLATLTHYDLLGVARDADTKAIKRAYFHLASIVHPDRYFGKRLGSYKPKLEALFARVTVAYETLSAPEARARYDATLGGQAPAAAAPPVPVLPVNRAEEAQAQAARDEDVRRRTDASARAKQYADAGARALAAGDFVAAAAAYRTARTHAPQDAALAAAHAEVTRAAGEKLRETYRRQALLEERWGHWAEAAASWKRVVEASPDDAEARDRLAAALSKTSGR